MRLIIILKLYLLKYSDEGLLGKGNLNHLLYCTRTLNFHNFHSRGTRTSISSNKTFNTVLYCPDIRSLASVQGYMFSGLLKHHCCSSSQNPNKLRRNSWSTTYYLHIRRLHCSHRSESVLTIFLLRTYKMEMAKQGVRVEYTLLKDVIRRD